MEIKRKESSENKGVILGSLSSGDCFYFATIDFAQAWKEDAFLMVCGNVVNDRVKVVSLSKGLLMERDQTHYVHSVDATLNVEPTK